MIPKSTAFVLRDRMLGQVDPNLRVGLMAAFHSHLCIEAWRCHLRWEKDPREARKTTEHLMTDTSVSCCLLNPFGIWMTVTVLSKASCKTLVVHFFKGRISMLDPWTLNIPTSVPAVASGAGGSRSHLEMGKSSYHFGCVLCFAHWSYWQASQSIPDCVSQAVQLRQLFS